jgi:hypothetical protein
MCTMISWIVIYSETDFHISALEKMSAQRDMLIIDSQDLATVSDLPQICGR